MEIALERLKLSRNSVNILEENSIKVLSANIIKSIETIQILNEIKVHEGF